MTDNNIATRLKLFFEYAGLTNSQFADACGIPRPTLSQILTGRNKKISDVLIGQIHQAFPKLSVLWLLFGEGNMLVTEKKDQPSDGENPGENEKSPTDGQEEIKEVIEIGVKEVVKPRLDSNHQAVKSIGGMSQNRVEIVSQPPVTRKISHITVYYDDSTFETFYPKK